MSKNDLFIPVILGTGRDERESENAAKFVFEEVKKHGTETEFVDVKSTGIPLTIPSWVEAREANSWREIAKKADAFVFVVPEYNRGYPGELKLLIDRAKDEYKYKPVVVCGVSNGGFGGARVVETLLHTWVTLQMIPVKSSVFFSNIKELFDEAGKITDDSYPERVQAMMDELVWYAETLKAGKELSNK